MEQEQNAQENNYCQWMYLIIYSAIVVFCAFAGKILGKDISDIVKCCIFTGIFFFSITLNIKLNGLETLRNRKKRNGLLFGFLFSFFVIVISTFLPTYNLWILGVLCITASADLYAGILSSALFAYFIQFVAGRTVEWFAFSFVMGTLFCLMIKFLKKKQDMFYIGIILLSFNVTLLLLLNNFIVDRPEILFLALSLLSTVLVLAAIYVLAFCDIKKTALFKEKEEKKVETLENKEEIKNVYSIEELLREDFELLLRMKEYSEHLYLHCTDVGEVSYQAAKVVQADAQLARAGGLYHEVGRIRGQNYIEEGLNLAAEYDFPDQVADLIRQHNCKFEKPHSIEAAIVMLTDSIISTIEYMQGQPEMKKVPPAKIIDNIFNIRLAKGTLDESGLSVQAFKQLKNFYKSSYFCL